MTTPDLLPISIIVHTRNSAQTLSACLESLPEVRELLVVDMQSSDDTLLIARRFHARTISVPDVGFVEPARAGALEQASQPWILIVDADETLPSAARGWLADLVQQPPAVYAVPRRNVMFGKPLEHTGWWPDYQVRFFAKGMVSWPATIHAQPSCTQKPVELPADEAHALVHQNYQHIDQFIDRMNRYTTIEAQKSAPAQTSADGDAQGWLVVQIRELFSRLVSHEGWRDGDHGLALSLLQSYYPLVSALKRWELTGFSSSLDFSSNIARQLDQLSRECAYWRAEYHVKNSSGLAQFYWKIRRKFQM